MLIPLKPAFQSYLWGGEKLKKEYKKETDLSPLAESWELSAREEAPSVIADGAYKGLTFPEYLKQAGKSVLGANAAVFPEFPLLIKLIDAKENLSVQVHPDDDFAAQYPGEEGKTEMWIVLEADPGAGLILGLKEPATREELAQRIAKNSLEEALEFIPVKTGDAFFIPPGTIHAIGKGLLIAEIQQNSNTTYRLYDYGRRDKDGNLRPLHIEKGLAAAALTPCAGLFCLPKKELLSGGTLEKLVSCPFFEVSRARIETGGELTANEDSFLSLLVTDGELTLNDHSESLAVSKGDSVFIPARTGIVSIEGRGELVVTTLPRQ